MEDVKKNDLMLVGSRYKKMFDHGNITWKMTKIRDIANIVSGFPFQSSLFNEENEGLPLIRIRDINSGFSNTYYS